MLQYFNALIISYVITGLAFFVLSLFFIRTLEKLLAQTPTNRYHGPSLSGIDPDEMPLPKLAFLVLCGFVLLWPFILYSLYDIHRRD
jgi:Sec-independent protein secretion pathway component TatC